MNISHQLKEMFEKLEADTVSDSFGGKSIKGKAPTFAFKPIISSLSDNISECEEPLSSDLLSLSKNLSPKGFKYALECLGRFSFCIELTNLNITSTKMKTRWVQGRITKTRPGTYENFEGSFAPGKDERAAAFSECYLIFCKCVSLLNGSKVHIELMENFSDQKRRGTPYEAVFTYINSGTNPIHSSSNIRLVNCDDARWLASSRPIIQSLIRYDSDGIKTKCVEKIATKSYKTDRSQTGEVQTNRAKRWECLYEDFQHATIEECWSVERKLLSDLVHFKGFPEKARRELIKSGLFKSRDTTLCPITLKPMVYEELLGGGEHGESRFQVGHMMPLKAGGKHQGGNIEWISNDGNRIQGSLNIEDTREMLVDIFKRMKVQGLIS